MYAPFSYRASFLILYPLNQQETRLTRFPQLAVHYPPRFNCFHPNIFIHLIPPLRSPQSTYTDGTTRWRLKQKIQRTILALPLISITRTPYTRSCTHTISRRTPSSVWDSVLFWATPASPHPPRNAIARRRTSLRRKRFITPSK